MTNGNDEGLANLFLTVMTILLLAVGAGIYFTLVSFSVPTFLSLICSIMPAILFWAYVTLA